MLPPFLGALLFLGTVASGFLALTVGLWAWVRKDGLMARRAAIFGGSVSGVYALAWILGLALSTPSKLPPGQAICFGGLDCHLHLSVVQAHQGDSLGVTVKFWSDARQAPEWPGELRFRLRDSAGTEYPPTNAVSDAALGAGETRLEELRFAGNIAPAGSVLIVTWKPGLDYFVPGSGNPLVQARRGLALSADPR